MPRTALPGGDRINTLSVRLTRRQLLRSASGLALGAGAAGLLAACAPQAPAPSSEKPAGGPPAQSVSTAVVPKDISGAATAAPAAPAAAPAATTAPAVAAKPAEAKPAAAAAPTTAARTGGML